MNSGQDFAAILNSFHKLESGSIEGGAALATLTRSWGPTFRRPGAAMLILSDGSVVSELAGGCPQRDIINRGLEVIDAGSARVVRYNRETGLDVLIETGCGGELEVFIEPLHTLSDLAHVPAINDSLRSRRRVTLATLFMSEYTVMARPQREVFVDGEPGWSGIVDPTLRAILRSRIDSMPSEVSSRTDRLCAAERSFDVLFQRIDPLHRLIVAGANATSAALAGAAASLGWQVCIVDSNPERLARIEVPDEVDRMCAPPQLAYTRVMPDRFSSLVAMTHNLEQDLEYLAAFATSPLAYVGVVGSRKRVQRVHSAALLPAECLHAPAGLDLGSETPPEIALSIAAEILAVLNHRDGGRLRDVRGPIHGDLAAISPAA